LQPVINFSKELAGASDEVDAAARLFAGLAAFMAEVESPVDAFRRFSDCIDALFGEDSVSAWVVSFWSTRCCLPSKTVSGEHPRRAGKLCVIG
jgi:hypothetical protein